MLQSEDTFATPLLLLLLDKYGPEALEWTPETIRRELEQDFQLKLPQENLDKIMAAIALVTTNDFFRDVVRFIELCNVLAGNGFQPDEFDPADAEEILLGTTEALMLWPPDGTRETEFSPEIQEYIRQVMKAEGILQPFDVLRLASNDDRVAIVDEAFLDDPEMYTAINDVQRQRQEELKSTLLQELSDLKQQLKMLPLENGDTSTAVQRLEKIIQQTG